MEQKLLLDNTMEKYLTQSEIKRCPLGKKYKKISYGGSKFFIKLMVGDGRRGGVAVEFFLRKNKWGIEKKERRVVYANNLKNALRRKLLFLNKHIVKKPVDLSMNEKSYDDLYADYADADELGYYKKNSPEYIRVCDILDLVNRNSVVYDAGCNSGGIGKILIRRKKCQVFGSEISPKLAVKARQKGVMVFPGRAEKTSFADNFFDYAVLSFILEHVLDPEKIMRETLRILKKGGVVLGHVPTEFGDWGKKTIGFHSEHLRAYSKKELTVLLKKFKLRSITIKKEKLVGRRISDYYFFKALK